jgi:hypothetical protein
VIYELKNPYKNGTTHVVFEPLDFIAGIDSHLQLGIMECLRLIASIAKRLQDMIIQV